MTTPRSTTAGRWTAPVLITGPGEGKTLAAAGKITAGVWVWKLPVLPLAS